MPRTWRFLLGLTRGDLARAGVVVAAAGAFGVADRVPGAVSSAVTQTWPPFALIAGLLLIGRVAADDGVFRAAGAWVAALPGGPLALLAGLLSLVACVTVVLNLDTSVVFLTPLLLEAARSRGLDERPFVYGTVFMSNAASLLLPGSNLTNLLVADGGHLPGMTFASRMLVPWMAAVTLTLGVICVAHRQALRGLGSRDARKSVPLRGRAGLGGAVTAAVLILFVPDAALAVLGVGFVVSLARLRRSDAPIRALLDAAHATWLLVLLAMAVAVGVIGRVVGVPSAFPGGGWGSTAAGAVSAVVLNNLPAAALLASHPPAHPLHLLLGLDLAPNLAVTGSLSAILWMRVARREGAAVSIWAYSGLGLVIVPLTLLAATLSLGVVPPRV
jgi:arsenical pump membrane protein